MTSPLSGKRVLVTRPRAQAEDFAARLRELGAVPQVMPAIEIEPLQDPAMLDSALKRLGHFDWIVFTSVNGVDAVKSRLEALGISPAELGSRRLAAIGPATADALEGLCRKPDLVPDEYVAEAIGRALGDVRGQRFLLARADIARPDLAQNLRASGAEVAEVAAYHIRAADPNGMDELDQPDFITLTSSSAAQSTIDRLIRGNRGAWLNHAALVCIGPITAQTVRSMGYPVAATAAVYTTDGLIETLLNLAQREVSHV